MAHAKFSPSAAHRWMRCPASWRQEQAFPDTTSQFAAEGSAAHFVAQMVLEGLGEPEDFIGHEVTEDGFTFTVDAEMAEFVGRYVAFCRGLMEQAQWHEVESESRFPAALQTLNDCWGTSDFVCQIGEVLHVVDLKYGQGVRVDAVDNEQLIIYGAAQVMGREAAGTGALVRKVVLTIVQPRIVPGPDWPTAELTRDELSEFVHKRLIPAIIACQELTPAFAAGDWCKFCKYRNVCAERAKASLAVAQDEFAMQPVGSLTPVQVAEILRKAEMLEPWVADARSYLLELLTKGVEVPGYKAVAKRASRQWVKEPEAVIRALRKAHPELKPKEFYRSEFVSVAQAEKLVGKAAVPAKLVASISSGFTLARDGDKRVGVTFTSGADDFAAITQENQKDN